MVKITLIIRCVFTIVYIIFVYNKRWIVENSVESVDKCVGHAIFESMNKKYMRCLCKPQIGKNDTVSNDNFTVRNNNL